MNPPTRKELVNLIYCGISDILYRPGSVANNRDYKKDPLTHLEEVFIIQILHQELNDPKLPGGLVFLYGQILEHIKNNIVYN